MARPNPPQSLTWFSRIWSTRCCSRRNLAQKSHASALLLSARWIAMTVLSLRRRTMRSGQRYQTAFQVCVCVYTSQVANHKHNLTSDITEYQYNILLLIGHNYQQIINVAILIYTLSLIKGIHQSKKINSCLYCMLSISFFSVHSFFFSK